MLLRYLAVAGALCLGRPVAAVEDGSDSLHPYIPPVQTFPVHELNLSCAECSFSYSNCLENTQPNAHLTIELSTREDVLLANGDVIFPAPVPMQFHATRYWDSSSEAVSLMFALDVLPLPRQPGGTPGDLYRLKLRLFDQQGRPATENDITVGLSRSDEGILELFQVAEDPIHYREHYQYDHDDDYDHRPYTGTHESWKAYLTSYMQGKPEHHPDHKPGPRKHCVTETATKPSRNGTNVEVVKTVCHTQHHHHHGNLDEWRERHFFRHMRPVILPGLLGIAAGIIACVVGFLVGKVIASVYLYVRGGRRKQQDPASPVHRDEEEGFQSEKQLLMQIYHDPKPPQSP